MSPMKFRRTCSSCNATFFATDRRAIYCPKCTRKKQEQHAQPIRDAATAGPHSNQIRSNPAGPKRKPLLTPKPPTLPAKPRAARPPKTAQLTDELRAKIEAAYYSLKDSTESLKKLHAKISHDLWAKPVIVAEVVKKLHHKPVKTEECTLSDAQRQQVITRFLDFVRSGTRPPEGRRSAIAKETNLPPREVILAVREWSNQNIGQLSRQQLFEIEKEYWRAIESGNHKFEDLPSLIAERVGFASADQVARWIDQLHDDTKIKKGAPLLSKEQTDLIIEQYNKYLQQPEPPEESLHWTLAKSVGVSPRQVHSVLCEYRCSHRPK